MLVHKNNPRSGTATFTAGCIRKSLSGAILNEVFRESLPNIVADPLQHLAGMHQKIDLTNPLIQKLFQGRCLTSQEYTAKSQLILVMQEKTDATGPSSTTNRLGRNPDWVSQWYKVCLQRANGEYYFKTVTNCPYEVQDQNAVPLKKIPNLLDNKESGWYYWNGGPISADRQFWIELNNLI